MATYKKNMIMRALSFWKTKLDESKKETVESEEDQKKEAAKEQADEEQAEIDAADAGTGDAGEDTAGDDELGFDPDADFDQAMDGDGSDEGEAEDDTGSDTADETGDDASEDEDGGEDAGDDESEDNDEDDGEDEEDSAEEAAEGDDENDEEESDFRIEITAPSKKLLDAIPDLCKKFGSKVSVTVAGLDPEGDDEEGGYVTAIECQDEETLNAVKEEDAVKEAVGGMDGELNESLQYEPNTVGAVIKLLSKSDPRDFLFIRLAPNMKQCMIYDIDRKVMAEGQSTTYLEIAIGSPNK
jgi:hypothetical protein